MAATRSNPASGISGGPSPTFGGGDVGEVSLTNGATDPREAASAAEEPGELTRSTDDAEGIDADAVAVGYGPPGPEATSVKTPKSVTTARYWAAEPVSSVLSVFHAPSA